jgi:hypothetical protein
MAAKRKKSSLATITKRVATRKRAAKKKAPARKKPAAKKNPAPADNPPVLQDITQVILPGVGAYAASRIVGRVAYKVARKKSPRMAKHAGAIAPAAYLIAVWFLVNKVKRLEDYHGPALIGASIGAIQSLLQTYLPQYGWILNDYHMDDVLPQQAQANGQQGQQGPAAAGQIEIGGNDFTPLPDGMGDDDIMDDLDLDDMYSGSLSGGLGGLGG